MHQNICLQQIPLAALTVTTFPPKMFAFLHAFPPPLLPLPIAPSTPFLPPLHPSAAASNVILPTSALGSSQATHSRVRFSSAAAAATTSVDSDEAQAASATSAGPSSRELGVAPLRGPMLAMASYHSKGSSYGGDDTCEVCALLAVRLIMSSRTIACT